MDAASLEQMNKLRKSLGLPLLPTQGAAPPSSTGPSFKEHDSDASEDGEPASTLETREAAGYSNWQQLQDEAEAKKRREAKVAALKKARDLSQKFSKLEGKGLGDVSEDADLDVKSWLKSQNKRMKKIEKERAERTAKELEERERLAAIEYTSADLAGVSVAHEVGDFEEENGEQILTLKDKAIGNGDDDDDDDDELEAAEIVARDKLTKKLDLKKKAAYDVHAENEDGERKILAQYDEDTGLKRKFTLDASGSNADAREAKRRAVGDLLQSSKAMISLMPLGSGDQPISDYVTEIKIKKPKKEKKKKREKALDDDDIFPVAGSQNGDSMDLDGRAPEAKAIFTENAFQDDDDLQLALAQSRRAAFKKKKRVRPEDIAKELRTDSPATPDTAGENEDGMVFDETTAFVENLQVTRLESKPARSARKSEEPSQIAPSLDGEGDVQMAQSYNDVEDGEDLAARLKREQSATGNYTTTGLEEEVTIDQGAGATLKLLKQRGLVKSDDLHELTEIQRQREFFLQERRNREAASEAMARAQREQDRKAGIYDRMSTKDRQEQARYENSRREQKDQREMAEFFNANYRPNVELKYVDETGRSLDQKEAFKHLSHQFHGKGSGKQKTEKRLKKIEDEQKKQSVSVLDSSRSVGMDRAQGAVGKKNKQAGVRLG
jgi:U4/U6.U5 tri-snRNP-associated protein 1